MDYVINDKNLKNLGKDQRDFEEFVINPLFCEPLTHPALTNLAPTHLAPTQGELARSD